VLSGSDKITLRHNHFLLEAYLPRINLLHHRHANRQLVNALHRKMIYRIKRRDGLASFEQHCRDTDPAFGESGDFGELIL